MHQTGTGMDSDAYCREIETYLCRRNDGHLIRIVGPAFARVCSWAQAGVPLQVVVEGIDRKLARHHVVGRRRRPLRIEFCEADVLDAFDEWRRAVGVTGAPREPAESVAAAVRSDDADRTGRHRVSLPTHIDGVLAQATNRLVSREAAPGVHVALEQVIADLEAVRRAARGARGTARVALLDRLTDIDRALLAAAKVAGASLLGGIENEARKELAPFKPRLDEAAYATALTACIDRLLRERLQLPDVRFD